MSRENPEEFAEARPPFHHEESARRLYFIIRSVLMNLIGAVYFSLTVYLLGSINWIMSLIVGGAVYIASMVSSRLFDPAIDKVTVSIYNFLQRYRTAQKLILKYF